MKRMICIFSILFLPLMGITEQLKNPFPSNELSDLFSRFKHLESSIENLEEGKIAFKELIDWIESEYSVELDIQNGYLYALNLIKILKIPEENKSYLTRVIEDLADYATNEVFYNSECCFLNCKNQKYPYSPEENEDVPFDMILGGLEIFSGVLLHFVPGCAWLGKIPIGDGLRRGLNGTVELDKKNKEKYATHQYYKKNSFRQADYPFFFCQI